MKRADDPSQHEIAVINGASITKEELIRRLELTPLPEFHKPGGRNKRALNLLIDELVVSQWAKEQGLEDLPGYKEAIDFVKQQAMIRELFFEEIRNRAEPDPQQTDETLHKSLQRVTVDVLFTRDESTADEWNKELQQGVSFDELVKEFEWHLSVRFSEQSFHWGDGTVPIPLEKMAYRLNVGEASGLIELPTGFAVLTVTNRTQDIFLIPYERVQKRDQVQQVLQARQETILANQYVERMLTPLGITQKAHGFQAVVGFLMAHRNFTTSDSVVSMSTYDVEFPRTEEHDLSLSVVVAPGLTWDGMEILSHIKKYKYPLSTGNRMELMAGLTRFLKITVRDYYLAKRARELGLEVHPRVKRDLATWSRYFLYLKGVETFQRSAIENERYADLNSWLEELTTQADINVNSSLLKSIELTGIPMLTVWDTDAGKRLVTPPLVSFRRGSIEN